MFSGSTITAANLIPKVRRPLFSHKHRLFSFKLPTIMLGINIDNNCSAALSRERRQAGGMTSSQFCYRSIKLTYLLEIHGVCYTVVKKGKKCGQRLIKEYTKEECCDNQIGEYAVAWGQDCELCPRSKGIHSFLVFVSV